MLCNMHTSMSKRSCNVDSRAYAYPNYNKIRAPTELCSKGREKHVSDQKGLPFSSQIFLFLENTSVSTRMFRLQETIFTYL